MDRAYASILSGVRLRAERAFGGKLVCACVRGKKSIRNRAVRLLSPTHRHESHNRSGRSQRRISQFTSHVISYGSTGGPRSISFAFLSNLRSHSNRGPRFSRDGNLLCCFGSWLQPVLILYLSR